MASSTRMKVPPLVALTRAPADNAPLAALLRARGVEVVEWPAVDWRPQAPEGGARALAGAVEAADVVAFTSRRGVSAAAHLGGADLVARLATRRLAAVGAATAGAIEALGLRVTWTSPRAGAAPLGAMLSASLPAGAAISLLRSAAADDDLPRALRSAGFRVEDLRVYANVEPAPPHRLDAPVRALACASPSAARRVLAWRPDARSLPFVAIGPTTASALRGLGVARVVTAATTGAAATCEALLEALEP